MKTKDNLILLEGGGNNILEKINKSAQTILASQSIKEVCKIIVEEGKNLTSSEQGLIYLSKANKLKIVYSTFSSNFEIKFQRTDFFQKAFTSGKVLILHKKELESISSLYAENKINSLILLPLLYQNKSSGMLLLFTSNEINYAEKEIGFMRLFRSFASIALEKTQLQVETQNALEIRDRFLSLASHELRTPLTSINGYIQLLHKKLSEKNDIESRWIKELYAESNRLTRLIKELLDINKIKQGNFQVLLREIKIENILTKSIKLVKTSNPETRINFQTSSKLPTNIIIGDSEKLFEMLTALISSITKLASHPKNINILLKTKARFIIIQIQTENKTIPKQEMQHIIEETMGAGLVLATHIANMHKGNLTISTKKNKGIVIEVKLPTIKTDE